MHLRSFTFLTLILFYFTWKVVDALRTGNAISGAITLHKATSPRMFMIQVWFDGIRALLIAGFMVFFFLKLVHVI